MTEYHITQVSPQPIGWSAEGTYTGRAVRDVPSEWSDGYWWIVPPLTLRRGDIFWAGDPSSGVDLTDHFQAGRRTMDVHRFFPADPRVRTMNERWARPGGTPDDIRPRLARFGWCSDYEDAE